MGGLGTAAAASRRAATAAAGKRFFWGEKPELAPLSAALRHGAGSEEVSPGLVQAALLMEQLVFKSPEN